MKNFSITIMGLIAVLSTMFVSCSQQEEIIDVEDISTKGEVVYNLHMDCSAPTYDEEKTTRATTSWAEGSVVYLIFKNGVTGTATYNNGKWMLKASSSLGTASDQKCTAAYVENPISVGAQKVDMNAGSVLYKGEGTYSVAYSDIYVKVALSPETWRLRFKGNKGTKISLPGNKNDIVYNNYIQFSSLLTSGTGADVSLTVNSNNYTNYIHGEFVNKNGNNTLYIINETEGVEYYRENISGNMLSAGKGGYLTIPTRDTYASLGWEIVEGVDPNAYIRPDILMTMTDGIVTNWTFGSSASTFCYMLSNSFDNSNDDEIIEYMRSNYKLYSVEEHSNSSFSSTGAREGTGYTLYTLAYNSSGGRGELHKTPITTKTSGLPKAVPSNISSYTYNNQAVWMFSLSLKNKAVKYYLTGYEGDKAYETEDYFIAYWLYKDIVLGKVTETYNETGNGLLVKRSVGATCLTLVTIALDSNGNLGDFSCAKYSTSSKSRLKPNVSDENGNGRDFQAYRKRPKIQNASLLKPFCQK